MLSILHRHTTNNIKEHVKYLDLDRNRHFLLVF